MRTPAASIRLLGDAELDEGAVLGGDPRPAVAELGEVVWVVDLNRQSLDRVVPDIGADRLQGMFAAAGWQVITIKYGRLLEELFTRPGGAALRARIDEMPNPEYQRLLRCDAAQLRERLHGDSAEIAGLLAERWTTPALLEVIRNLGGHDLGCTGCRVRRHRRQPADGHFRLHHQGQTDCPPRATRRITRRC